MKGMQVPEAMIVWAYGRARELGWRFVHIVEDPFHEYLHRPVPSNRSAEAFNADATSARVIRSVPVLEAVGES